MTSPAQLSTSAAVSSVQEKNCTCCSNDLLKKECAVEKVAHEAIATGASHDAPIENFDQSRVIVLAQKKEGENNLHSNTLSECKVLAKQFVAEQDPDASDQMRKLTSLMKTAIGKLEQSDTSELSEEQQAEVNAILAPLTKLDKTLPVPTGDPKEFYNQVIKDFEKNLERLKISSDTEIDSLISQAVVLLKEELEKRRQDAIKNC